MPTMTPLYPNGYEQTDADLNTKKDDNHQTIVPFSYAMDEYWQKCQAQTVVTITVHDYPLPGNTTIIGSTLSSSARKDFFGSPIPQNDPRKLIGVTGFQDYGSDFASPMEFDSVLETGQAFGGDNTYSAAYTFKGLLWFNPSTSLPFIVCNIGMTSVNGAVLALSVTEPTGNPNRVQGPFLTIDGQALQVWFNWQGFPFVSPPEMTATVTSTQTFIWP